MKQSLLLLLTLGLLAVGLAGCDTSSPDSAASSVRESPAPAGSEASPVPVVKAEDLLHRHFVLLTADGVSYTTKEVQPTLEFQEELRVSGGICNRFTGQGKLRDGMLFVSPMAMTRMHCADTELNTLEANFSMMLEKGASLAFDGKLLHLRGNGHELIYEVRDRVQ